MSGASLARAAAAFLVMSQAAFAASAQTVPEPDSYRTDQYKAPVPATLRGARVVTTDEAADLWRRKAAVFVDVLPRPPKPDLPEGTVWREPAHRDIPGSLWLPDVGFGGLSPEMERWFGDKLAASTGGDRSKTLVIYCRSECWMSWNAAKRAIGWGYSAIVWYPDGVEGWTAAGLPLEDRVAAPRPAELN